jgi:hypothetical protein
VPKIEEGQHEPRNKETVIEHVMDEEYLEKTGYVA